MVEVVELVEVVEVMKMVGVAVVVMVVVVVAVLVMVVDGGGSWHLGEDGDGPHGQGVPLQGHRHLPPHPHLHIITPFPPLYQTLLNKCPCLPSLQSFSSPPPHLSSGVPAPGDHGAEPGEGDMVRRENGEKEEVKEENRRRESLSKRRERRERRNRGEEPPEEEERREPADVYGGDVLGVALQQVQRLLHVRQERPDRAVLQNRVNFL